MAFDRAGKNHITLEFWVDPATGQFEWQARVATEADTEQLYRCMKTLVRRAELPPRRTVGGVDNA